MGSADAKELLLKLARPRKNDHSEEHFKRAEIIAGYVGHLPLGLELAGACIAQMSDTNLQGYTRWVEEQNESSINDSLKSVPAAQYLSQYQMGVFDTWRRSFKVLIAHNSNAALLLQTCAFFDKTQLNIHVFREAVRTKYYWTAVGQITKLKPESARVPDWLVSLATNDNGDWDKTSFERTLSDLENFCFVRKEIKGVEDLEDDDYDLWIHPLVQQWAKEDLEPKLKKTVALNSIWIFLQSIDDCALQADKDLLHMDMSHAFKKATRWLRALHFETEGIWQAALHSTFEFLRDVVGDGEPVSFLFRSGQFQTGAGGIMDSFLDLMLILQDFRLLLDRAYCSELDPRHEYKSLPQFEFHDTYAVLMAFQARKFSSSEIENASDIFSTAKEFCKGKSEYARALLLSCTVVHDALHWDRLARWAPLIDELILKLKTPGEDLEFSILTIAACAQLAISFSYAVGLNHHNNTNPFADPMNFPDKERHEAVEVLASLAKVALRCLEMIKSYQDAFEGKISRSELTLTSTVQWQLQLGYAFHCLREGRPDQAGAVFRSGVANIQTLKGPEPANAITKQIEYASKTHQEIGRMTLELGLMLAEDPDTSHDDRDNFIDLVDRLAEEDPGVVETLIEECPAPRDRARYLPRIVLRRKRGRLSEESNSSKSQPPEGTIADLIPMKTNETPEAQVEPAMYELRPRGSRTLLSWLAEAKVKEKADNMITRFNDTLSSRREAPVPSYATALVRAAQKQIESGSEEPI
jgi:hypothetical protein